MPRGMGRKVNKFDLGRWNAILAVFNRHIEIGREIRVEIYWKIPLNLNHGKRYP